MSIRKFVTHNKQTASIAKKYGWLPGARYTNLRDVREADQVGFLDINWKNYNFEKHLEAVKQTKPILTVAKDVEDISDLCKILEQAYTLAEYSRHVVIVPKDPRMAEELDFTIPKSFILGYSVSSSYGSTNISPKWFRRPVHLLGGRPDTQRRLAEQMPVISLDCNRFTLDAAFGDYFDGDKFRPHPVGGYYRCIEESLNNINLLWNNYKVPINSFINLHSK